MSNYPCDLSTSEFKCVCDISTHEILWVDSQGIVLPAYVIAGAFGHKYHNEVRRVTFS